MNTEELIKIIVQSDCEISDYGSHTVAWKATNVEVIVTIPNVPRIAINLARKILAVLGINIKF